MKCLMATLAMVALLPMSPGAQTAGSGEAPPPVPLRVNRTLDRSSYVELASRWKAYIDANGDSADALVNLARAYEYSDEIDAAKVTARRAVAIAPDDPAALALLGKLISIYDEDTDAAIKLLEHCRAVAPDYGDGLTMLGTLFLRRGDLNSADDVFRATFDQHVYSRPLQDYAYNMLVALPEGAVLITAGDNDTFPVLALQAGMHFRTDVLVMNRSLLNLPDYAVACFARRPEVRPNYDIRGHEVTIVDGKLDLLPDALMKRMIEESKVPLYLSVSAAGVNLPYQPAVAIEGVNMRASGKAANAQAAARWFFDTYRLDSATDWTIPWSLAPNEAGLVGNYATAMIKYAGMKGVERDTRTRLLDKAAAIAKFHDMQKVLAQIESMRGR